MELSYFYRGMIINLFALPNIEDLAFYKTRLFLSLLPPLTLQSSHTDLSGYKESIFSAKSQNFPYSQQVV